MADQHDLAPAAVMDLGLAMHLGDQRTGGVEREQIAPRRLRGNAARHAVRGEDHRRVGVRDLVEFLDENRALGAQALDHVAVVHDLVAHIDRRPVDRERPLHRFDGAHHARRRTRAASTAAPSGCGFFGGVTAIMSSKSRDFSRVSCPDMGCAAPPCQAGTVARGQLRPYIPATFRSSPMIWCFARQGGRSVEEILPWRQPAPLMPKATAVWLLDNTALSFDQIADFCKLHPLEVKAIADGDAAQGIKGLDPIQTGQLTPRADHRRPKPIPTSADAHRAEGRRFRSPSAAARRARATRRCRAGRTGRTPSSGWCAIIPSSRTARSCGWSAPPSRPSRRSATAPTGTRRALAPMDPVTLGLATQTDLDFEVKRANKEKPAPARHRRDAAARRRNHRAQGGRSRRRRRRSREQAGRQRPRRQRRVRQAQAARRQEATRRRVTAL